MTKTRAFKCDTKTSLFSGKGTFLQNLFLRNEPNLSSQKFTTNPCGIEGYNDFHPKTKNGTNPNEPNLKPISNTTKTSLQIGKGVNSSTLICKSKPNFPTQRIAATSCSGCTYINLHPQTHKKSKPNPNPIKANLKLISNTLKPSLFQDRTALLRNLFMRNKANFNRPNLTANPCSRYTYNDLHPKTQNGTKPNKANLKPIPNTLKPSPFSGEPPFSSTLICKNKPNFPTQRITATTCKRSTYDDLHPQTNKKNKPNTNPIKPNFPRSRRSFNEDGRHRTNTLAQSVYCVIMTVSKSKGIFTGDFKCVKDVVAKSNTLRNKSQRS